MNVALVGVLICGQVREEETFRKVLLRLDQARHRDKIGRIVFSTWQGEIDRYDGLREHLVAMGVELSEVVAPSNHMDSQGNYYYQATQFLNGLDRFSPHEIVFKTRAEIRLNLALDWDAFADFAERQLAPTGAGEFLPQKRIGVSVWSPTIPFWIEDRFFYGQCSDLRRMIGLSRSGDILCNTHNMIAEIRWFGNLFIDSYPAIRQFMRILWMHRAYESNIESRDKFFDRDIMYQGLAAYYYIIDSFFAPGFDRNIIDLSVYAGSLEPPPLLLGATPESEMSAIMEKSSHQEMRAALTKQGMSYLSDPALVTQLRIGINQISRETQYLPELIQPASL